MISFGSDWFNLAIQGTLKSLLQHHNSKASILWGSAFFMVKLSHPYMTTGKTIVLAIRTFVGKVVSLLFNMLSRFFIAFLPRSKRLLVSWVGKIPCRRAWQPTPVFLPGEAHGQRSLAGHSPRGRREADVTEAT